VGADETARVISEAALEDPPAVKDPPMDAAARAAAAAAAATSSSLVLPLLLHMTALLEDKVILTRSINITYQKYAKR